MIYIPEILNLLLLVPESFSSISLPFLLFIESIIFDETSS